MKVHFRIFICLLRLTVILVSAHLWARDLLILKTAPA